MRPWRSVERQRGGGILCTGVGSTEPQLGLSGEGVGREPRIVGKTGGPGERRPNVLPKDMPRALPSLGCSQGFVNRLPDGPAEKRSVLFLEALKLSWLWEQPVSPAHIHDVHSPHLPTHL